MEAYFICFESFNAYCLYHYITDTLQIKVTHESNVIITENMMEDAMLRIYSGEY